MSRPTFFNKAANSNDCNVYGFFEKSTSTWTYLVSDDETREAFIIDSVLDYDPISSRISTDTADGLLDFVKEQNLKVTRILETHAHADHLTAAQYLKRRLGGNVPVGIGKHITKVQATFKSTYGLHPFATDGSQFDTLFSDGDEVKLGSLKSQVLHLPGHTPDHVGYLIGESVFTGDSIFMPDVGSARSDFPGGSATDLFASANRLLALPPHYRLYVGHDYPPTERQETGYATVAEQREMNKHLKSGTGENEFVEWRAERDATLASPRLLHASLQVNLRAGALPDADEEGRIFFKLPVRVPAGF
ncbi:hypothetical protein HK097_008393 [Rhizophlyctis rosea]|uniref:Metallo-beta-lactamase domain-containing protein n=1 Tax=Rhizophlyctis rosea TaxID=64517 RepID=A0AAD5SCG0_9FUNG|nr:hypothetical protein HK097_008393 [Rhizophlyctis rosea]